MKHFYDMAGYGVRFFKGLQELQIGYIAGHATDIFRVQFADNAHETSGARENLQNILPVFFQLHIASSELFTGSSQLGLHHRSRFSPDSARGQTRLPAA